MANASLKWIESVLRQGDTHPPFFAWIGPHAPHLPATPAPWYADHPIGLLRAPRGEPWYNYSGVDHHPLVAQQPILSTADAQAIDVEYAKRMRSLLSVDDMVLALFETLSRHGEWDRTFVVFSSDHGYSLGQFRLPSHKMQVCARVISAQLLSSCVSHPVLNPNPNFLALNLALHSVINYHRSTFHSCALSHV